jgi:cholesterol transport system auxiliary component
MQRMNSKARAMVAAAAVLALAGCISLGKKAPDQLLYLTPASAPAAGASASGDAQTAIAVANLEAPRKLDVTRVPVLIDASSLAYLKNAEWVDTPTRLFGRLLAETLRAKGDRLVVTGDTAFSAATRLSGTLSAMDYDASRGAAVVRFDAVLQSDDGAIRSKRFESEVTGVPPESLAVGEALNRAANDVASQVAEWVG